MLNPRERKEIRSHSRTIRERVAYAMAAVPEAEDSVGPIRDLKWLLVALEACLDDLDEPDRLAAIDEESRRAIEELNRRAS